MGIFDEFLNSCINDCVKGDEMKIIKCENKTCEENAIAHVYWPGQHTKMCLDHATEAKKLAEVLGFSLSLSPIDYEKE